MATQEVNQCLIFLKKFENHTEIMKNTRAHVKKNPTIRLETNLPPRGRQNWALNGAQNQNGSHSQEQVLRTENTQHIVEERGSSGRDARSHHGLSDDDFFDTPQVFY